MTRITAEWEEHVDTARVTSLTVEYDCGYVWWVPLTMLENETALHHARLADSMIMVADMTHDAICTVCRA